MERRSNEAVFQGVESLSPSDFLRTEINLCAKPPQITINYLIN